MLNGLMVLATTFIGIFLKGFQHKNIQHDRYVWMTVLSYIICVCELLTVTLVVKSGLGVVLYAGTGAALGMVCGVLTHNKYLGKTRCLSFQDILGIYYSNDNNRYLYNENES